MNESLATQFRALVNTDLTATSPADLIRALATMARIDAGTYAEGDKVTWYAKCDGEQHTGTIKMLLDYRAPEARVLEDGQACRTTWTLPIDQLRHHTEDTVLEGAGAR